MMNEFARFVSTYMSNNAGLSVVPLDVSFQFSAYSSLLSLPAGVTCCEGTSEAKP